MIACHAGTLSAIKTTTLLTMKTGSTKKQSTVQTDLMAVNLVLIMASGATREARIVACKKEWIGTHSIDGTLNARRAIGG